MAVDAVAISAPSFASFDVLDRTQGRSVHNVLLDAMFSKSRFEEVLGGGISIPQPRHEWISLAAPAQFVTADGSGANTVDGGATNKVLSLSAADVLSLRVGAVLVNVSRATPIGTYQRNELLMVTEMTSTTTVTCARDYGNFAGGAGNGSTVHGASDVYRILYFVTQEGSVASLDPNTYSADTILENYSAINTMKMQLTGSQKARAMEVVDSEVERQWQRELIKLKNQRANMHLYGTNSAAATVGSDTLLRDSKGIMDFIVDNIVAANPLVDYTSTTLTYKAINDLFIRLFNNGADPSEQYKIVTSATSKDVMSQWDSDIVRLTIQEGQTGREVIAFKSSLGFNAEIIAEPMVAKSDVFIINPSKITPAIFRPYEKQEWGKGTSAPNGDDMWYQRTIGEETLMIHDPGTAHALLTYLTWI
jgi:hypothetical protein